MCRPAQHGCRSLSLTTSKVSGKRVDFYAPEHAWLCLQLEEEFVQANPAWVQELEIMVTSKVKAEIQALSSFGFQYLSQVYLPLKLQEGDWI